MVNSQKAKVFGMIFLEVTLFLFVVILFSQFPAALGETIGVNNVTVRTGLEIGNTAPEIVSIEIENIELIPNDTKTVNCAVEIVDFDTADDIRNVSAELFDNTVSSYGNETNNKYHYINEDCEIDREYGDINTALANCTFDVYYYANPGEWNCTVEVDDYSGYSDKDSNLTNMEVLLALGLPDVINYGEVNATYVSQEQIANVTNFGNVKINLSLQGYAQELEDGYAMNCSLGSSPFIPVYYEKFNLTAPTVGDLSLSEFEGFYENLTATSIIKDFGLESRENEEVNDAIKPTYWRIYVPRGVAGTCEGNIVFGAVQESGG